MRRWRTCCVASSTSDNFILLQDWSTRRVWFGVTMDEKMEECPGRMKPAVPQMLMYTLSASTFSTATPHTCTSITLAPNDCHRPHTHWWLLLILGNKWRWHPMWIIVSYLKCAQEQNIHTFTRAINLRQTFPMKVEQNRNECECRQAPVCPVKAEVTCRCWWVKKNQWQHLPLQHQSHKPCQQSEWYRHHHKRHIWGNWDSHTYLLQHW